MTIYNPINPITGEEWRTVRGYEGRYEVSSLGRVRSLDRKTIDGRRIRGRTLAQSPGHAGNPLVVLCYDGNYRSRQVNRLVAEAFIKRPSGLLRPDVYHNDGDPANCRASNLKWVPRGYSAGLRTSQHFASIRERMAIGGAL